MRLKGQSPLYVRASCAAADIHVKTSCFMHQSLFINKGTFLKDIYVKKNLHSGKRNPSFALYTDYLLA